MAVSKEQILELRAETSAPIMECRKAIEAAKGDMDRAKELLREYSAKAAEKKSDREMGQGTVGMYVHDDGRIAAMVVLRCETDFVGKNEAFKQLAKDIAMQVVAMNPSVVKPEEAPEGVKPEEIALLSQPFIKDPSGEETVKDTISAKVLELGENIQIEKFIRFNV